VAVSFNQRSLFKEKTPDSFAIICVRYCVRNALWPRFQRWVFDCTAAMTSARTVWGYLWYSIRSVATSNTFWTLLPLTQTYDVTI